MGGGEFKAVIVLDGDSIMPAETMVPLARTMEGNDNIGLIQVPGYEVGAVTLLGKAISFIFVATPVTDAARSYFRLGRAPFYGHHTILRTEAVVKHCTLPILSGTRIFAAGKPKSHDVVESMLMEGAGWETYILPHLAGFDQQIHTFIDWAVRENRWVFGCLDWFALWRYKNLSSYGKLCLVFWAASYGNTWLGFIGLCFSYYGCYYLLKHYEQCMIIFHLYAHWFYLMAFISIFTFFSPIFVTTIYHHKIGTLKKVGGVVKLIFSYLLKYQLEAFFSFIKMLCVARSVLKWLQGTEVVWGAQDREYRGALSWEKCFKFSWYISAVGLMFFYFVYTYILPLAGAKSYIAIFFWIGIPICAMVFAPVTVRLSSRPFPLLTKMGWFKQQWSDENEHPVVRETRNMTGWFGERVPETYSFEQALSDPYFALRHLAQCPSRPQKYAFWKDKLAGRNIQDLTRLEKLVVFRCRELWEMFMTKNLDVAQEKQQ